MIARRSQGKEIRVSVLVYVVWRGCFESIFFERKWGVLGPPTTVDISDSGCVQGFVFRLGEFVSSLRAKAFEVDGGGPQYFSFMPSTWCYGTVFVFRWACSVFYVKDFAHSSCEWISCTSREGEVLFKVWGAPVGGSVSRPCPGSVWGKGKDRMKVGFCFIVFLRMASCLLAGVIGLSITIYFLFICFGGGVRFRSL